MKKAQRTLDSRQQYFFDHTVLFQVGVEFTILGAVGDGKVTG